MFDCTSYPDTFDPKKQFLASDEIVNNEILGLNTNQDRGDEGMLSLTIYLF